MAKRRIKVTSDGPYLVSGNVPLSDEKIVVDNEGIPIRWEKGKNYKDQKEYSLCRCGKSKNKPYCDGSHLMAKFKGKETAKNVPFDKKAEVFIGPEIILKDYPKLCAHARFCDRAGGIWELIKKDDAKSVKIAKEEAFDCPSGRLVVAENKKKDIEPKLRKEIAVTKHEDDGIGPYWIKASIPVESASGRQYEIRNRVTLCRCGRSKNKPFCDGEHREKVK